MEKVWEVTNNDAEKNMRYREKILFKKLMLLW